MWERWLFKRVMDKNSVRLVENYCLYSRNKEASCTACLDVCQKDALSLIDGKMKLDQKKCNDCKLCVQHCPTDALYLESEMLHSYEKKIIARENVCFTCEKQKTSNDDVVIPCLSSLSPELVLIALMHNKSVQIYYNSTKCKDCPLNYNVAKSMEWLQELDYISYGDVHIIDDIFEKKAKKKDLTRRELFSATKNKAKDEVGTLLLDSFDQSLSVKDKIPLPDRRKYLAEFVKREEKEKFLSMNLAEGLKLTKIKVNDNCNLCERCVKLCPTGALKLAENDGKLSLTYKAIQCINCEICSDNCSYIDRSIDTCLCEGLIMPKVVKSSSFSECKKCGGKIIDLNKGCRDCFEVEKKHSELFANW